MTVNTSAYIHRTWRYVELQFSADVTQTRMLRWFPYWLHVDYTRTMLAALWLHPQPKHIGIIGLGGGAQTKFCYRHLPQAQIEVAESNSDVIGQRQVFHIPENDERLHIHCRDGSYWLRQRRMAAENNDSSLPLFDLLLIDGYDRHGIPAALSSQGFYDDCQAALAANGVLASNLYASPVRLHLNRLARSFNKRVLVLDEPERSNQVVIAWNGNPQPDSVHLALKKLPEVARWQLRNGFKRLAAAWEERQI